MATISIMYLKGYFITKIMDDTGFTKMYQKLKNPLNSGTLTKKNLCMPRYRSLDGKPRDAHACKKFVKSSELENLKKNIKKIHSELIPDEPSIQQEIAKKN